MGSGDGDAASSAGSKPNSLSRAPKTPQSQQSPHKPTVSAEPPKPHSLSRATLSTAGISFTAPPDRRGNRLREVDEKRWDQAHKLLPELSSLSSAVSWGKPHPNSVLR